MNFARIDEIRVEQKAINTILSAWTTGLNQDHHYSLRNTVVAMLDYVMEIVDEKPAVNPLVDMYTPMTDVQRVYVSEAIDDYNMSVEEDGYKMDTEYAEDHEMIEHFAKYIGNMADVHGIV